MPFARQSSGINVSHISQARKPREDRGGGLFQFDEDWFTKLRTLRVIAEAAPKSASNPQETNSSSTTDRDILADNIAHSGYCAAWDAYDRSSNPYGPEMLYADTALAARWDKGWVAADIEIRAFEAEQDSF